MARSSTTVLFPDGNFSVPLNFLDERHLQNIPVSDLLSKLDQYVSLQVINRAQFDGCATPVITGGQTTTKFLKDKINKQIYPEKCRNHALNHANHGNSTTTESINVDESDDLKWFKKEIVCLCILRCEFIATLRGIIEPHKCILLERCDKTLKQLVSNEEYTTKEIWKVLKCIQKALAYLSEHHFILRNARSDNILLAFTKDKLTKAVLSDFSCLVHEDNNNLLVEPSPYWPPEVRDGQLMSHKGDMFALGVIIWEMFHRRDPPESKHHYLIDFEPSHPAALLSNELLSNDILGRPTAFELGERIHAKPEGRANRFAICGNM